MEKSFRQALIAEQGNVLVFFERPLSATFMGLAALLFVFPLIKRMRDRRRAKVSPAE
jgi:putative tricarboxylic transport membrane protein